MVKWHKCYFYADMKDYNSMNDLVSNKSHATNISISSFCRNETIIKFERFHVVKCIWTWHIVFNILNTSVRLSTHTGARYANRKSAGTTVIVMVVTGQLPLFYLAEFEAEHVDLSLAISQL